MINYVPKENITSHDEQICKDVEQTFVNDIDFLQNLAVHKGNKLQLQHIFDKHSFSVRYYKGIRYITNPSYVFPIIFQLYTFHKW